SVGGTAAIEEELLEEVVYLVEYPTVILGQFDAKYLALPPEAVITPMREHQRYFPVKDKSGQLLPVFITVRCGSAEHVDIVRHGNERVLRARLDDARFFFDEDKKIPLQDRVEALKNVVFQEGLGSVYDKTTRLVNLAKYLAQTLKTSPQEAAAAARCAYLAKADLVTNMVGEFSELQGIMGQEYALLNGEQPEVAQAIFEHYLPRFAGDSLAQSAPGRIVGLADKIDNLAATFSRGLIPTGSQDPYALRRQALGIVHTLIDAEYSLSLAALTEQAFTLLKIAPEKQQELNGAIAEFFRARLKNVLNDKNVPYDIIDAVLAAGTDDIYDACLRAAALADFVTKNTAAPEALQALKRVGNLAKQAQNNLTIDPALFETDAEKELYQAYSDLKEKSGQLIAAKQYPAALAGLVFLTKPVNDFFASVMVMVENEAIKQNRLALLAEITGLAAQIADLNKLV
ncbi:MAG: glycine--tRNA ligase subunit beta, partial [Sporomusaceae bacterium]|nr:glycine--tRNA ligase subunit beta [Sporomusaceae bacterium]